MSLITTQKENHSKKDNMSKQLWSTMTKTAYSCYKWLTQDVGRSPVKSSLIPVHGSAGMSFFLFEDNLS